MNRIRPLLVIALLCGLLDAGARAQAPGITYRSAPCRAAPRIDGIDSPGEWDGAARAPIELRMGDAKGEARPARAAELRLMNGASNLYVALRVPDAARDMQTDPVLADLAVLAFCRGDELGEGDDRRVVLPGLFADKHVVSPGKDADDARRDGQAAMRWRRAAGGGEYFIEWQVPLASGDRNDVHAAPGERLRFNLVYADRFSPTLAQTELGGLFGSDTDHAQGWGAIALAAGVDREAPAAAPAWLARLFPNTEKPDRLARRLRRVDAGELEVAGRLGGSVIVELAYPGLDGRDESGQARIFLPPGLGDESARRVPLIHNAGYEIDEAGAAPLLARGYAVATPHAHPLNPLVRGVNLDRAILHAALRLPCIDPLRVSVQGGSAGGWMTLMLAADAFPLVWAMPDVPPIHWGYNAAYIGEQQPLAAAPAGSDQPRMPVLKAVGPIAEQSQVAYGMPYDSATFLAVSPLAHLETITAPTLAVFSTADMLVPVDQVGAELVQPHDPERFPAGFTTAMTDRFPGIGGRRTLLTALPAERYQLFRLPPVDNPVRAGSGGASKPLALPFTKDHIWSIAVINEGTVEPAVGHFKYQWALDREPFRQWAEASGVTPGQLTAPKLERLMKRLRGEPWQPLRVRPGGKGDPIAGNQLDYPEAERADVLLGLAAFAADDARAVRLGQLYGALPVERRALGDRLGDGTASGVRAALAALAGSPAPKP